MGLNRSKNITSAKKTCDQWFSKYIRIRDANHNGLCKCITCDTIKHWKEMDAGHFQSRRYMATRYEEKNCHAQCQRCNQYGAGEQYLHGQAINLLYGKGAAENIVMKSNFIQKMTKNELMELARYYQQETLQLAKEKSIEL